MSSLRFSNKYLIPKKFPEILHDYSREVVRYMPKDILDFSIQYFRALELNKEFNYVPGYSSVIQKETKQESVERKQKSQMELSQTNKSTKNTTSNIFYGINDKNLVNKDNTAKAINLNKPNANISIKHFNTQSEMINTNKRKYDEDDDDETSKHFVDDIMQKSEEFVQMKKSTDRALEQSRSEDERSRKGLKSRDESSNSINNSKHVIEKRMDTVNEVRETSRQETDGNLRPGTESSQSHGSGRYQASKNLVGEILKESVELNKKYYGKDIFNVNTKNSNEDNEMDVNFSESSKNNSEKSRRISRNSGSGVTTEGNQKVSRKFVGEVLKKSEEDVEHNLIKESSYEK